MEKYPIGYSFEVEGVMLDCSWDNTELRVYQSDFSFMNCIYHQLPNQRKVKIFNCQDDIDNMFEYGWDIVPDLDIPTQSDIEDYLSFVHENIGYEFDHLEL